MLLLLSCSRQAWRRITFAAGPMICGSKLGYLEATLAYGLAHPVLGNDFQSHAGAAISAEELLDAPWMYTAIRFAHW